MRQDVEITDFSKGELSPSLLGRSDIEGYYKGCATLLNMVVMLQGGATRRPGTLYQANAKSSADTTAGKVKLVEFTYNTENAYILEFGDAYVRVFADGGPVVNSLTVTGAANNGVGLIRLTVASTTGLYTGNTAVVASVGGVPNATGTWIITVISGTTFDLVGSTFAGLYTAGGTAAVAVEFPATGWTSPRHLEISYAQSNDALVVVHPQVPPQIIRRVSHTNWNVGAFTALDGPYLPSVTGQGTLTLSANAGAVNITFSVATGINDGVGLTANDVGRFIRFTSVGTSWCWMIITSVVTALTGTATIQPFVNNGATTPADGVGPSGGFAMGAWGVNPGYPILVSFFQQRLFFIGTTLNPNRIDGSQPNDFLNFAPTAAAGTVNDANAVSWRVYDDQTNDPRWVRATGSSTTPQLAVGNSGSEVALQAGGSAQALTPTSVQAFRETNLGGASNSRAWRINKSVLFASAGGRQLYEWSYDWQVGGSGGINRTVDSDHITVSGIVDTAFQKRPHGIAWCILANGGLIGMTYLTLLSEEKTKVGWHRHQLGGDYYGGPPFVESLACIPSPDEAYDQLWLAVKRTINGSVVRTIEMMSQFFDTQAQENAIFMDLAVRSTLTYPSGTLVADTMVVSTSDTPVTVTWTASAATPFAAGNVGSVMRYNDGIGLVTGFTSTTVLTGNWYRAPTNLKPALTTTWSLTAQFNSFSGLTHLQGQVVQILGDGADFGTETVAAGAVSLDPSRGEASYATIGLPYEFRLVTMPWAAKAAVMVQGRIKTIATLFLRFLKSLGCDYGRLITDEYTNVPEDTVDTLQTRSALNLVGSPPPLFTGIERVPSPGGHDQEGQILIKGSGPYPCTILAIGASGDVGELPGGG